MLHQGIIIPHVVKWACLKTTNHRLVISFQHMNLEKHKVVDRILQQQDQTLFIIDG